MTTYALTSSTSGFAVPTDREKRPEPAPEGLIVTRAVQVKDGWVGQVIVDRVILWQSEPVEEDREAVRTANQRVVEAIRKLLA